MTPPVFMGPGFTSTTDVFELFDGDAIRFGFREVGALSGYVQSIGFQSPLPFARAVKEMAERFHTLSDGNLTVLEAPAIGSDSHVAYFDAVVSLNPGKRIVMGDFLAKLDRAYAFAEPMSAELLPYTTNAARRQTLEAQQQAANADPSPGALDTLHDTLGNAGASFGKWSGIVVGVGLLFAAAYLWRTVK